MSERVLLRLVRAAAAAVVRECDAITREQSAPELSQQQATVSVDSLTQRAAKRMLQQLGRPR